MMKGKSALSSQLCSRCYKREACIQCCGVRLCLRHFHTTNHSSKHPEKAVIIEEEALERQRPAFEKMWKEAFQSVAEDIGFFSREVEAKVAKDPLGAIGLGGEISAGPVASASGSGGEKGVKFGVERRSKRTGQAGTKAQGATGDPFARRRTRPKSCWSVSIQGEDMGGEGKAPLAPAKSAAALAAAAVSGYNCESCGSPDTTFDVIGGGGMGARKAETWGNKDAPEMTIRVRCQACYHTWIEER
ncbi:unnamed protein product [Choristocarpus tenellus]